MEQYPNTISEITNKGNLQSLTVKQSFFTWLCNGNAKKYAPVVYLSCMDKVSDYLIFRKISSVELWQYTNFALFRNIYDKVINDKLLKATDGKMYTLFIQVGLNYLKFLKSKPNFQESIISYDASSQSCHQLTIREAIISVLESEQCGMTVEEIYNRIIEKNLYSFGARNPLDVVRNQINSSCEGTNYTYRSSKDYFRYETHTKGKKGEKIYFLLSEIYANEIHKSSANVNGKLIKSDALDKGLSNIKIWNDSIEHNFLNWMKSKNYVSSIAQNYCNTVNQTIKNFKILVDTAVSDSSTQPEAVRKFVALISQNKKFIDLNNKTRNQLSTVLGILVQFIDEGSPVTTATLTSIHKIKEFKLKDIVDLDEGKRGIRKILNAHFLTLYGYSNINILWSAAQNSLSMFLNDNAINSINGFWSFIGHVFKDEFVYNFPHIWENAPSYLQNSKGLVMNLATQHGGIVTRKQIDDFFSRIKLTTLLNSFILSDGQLLFYDNAEFILTETVNLSEDRCSLITKELDALFSNENVSFIVPRDISREWFTRLPELPNSLLWTPLLLQELLRIRPNIGYRVILPSLKGQALDTVGAAIVHKKSEFETFADVVHRFCFERYNLPFKFSAEGLRLDLREAGMLCGNELIYNMHRVLKDHRFAFSNENKTVMILER